LLGVAPGKCMAFEDAPAGIEAAKAAGMIVVGVETHYKRSELGVELAIPDFRLVSNRVVAGGIAISGLG
jgi:sugar-phosphatase